MSSTEISQLQLLQQNLQTISMQRQQFESQLVELDSALSELNKSPQAYKVVGRIMIASSAEELKKSLVEEKEITQLRINNLLKQEESIQKTMEDKRERALAELKKNKKEE
ncbi:prefoldin subunit [Candidatus Woesearchaeota archaeon]|nr:prefoldin subunit [Candidatus Woesearchaeota archaeon]